MSSTIHLELHQDIEHLQALLAATASSSNGYCVDGKSRSSISHYDIRHCLRKIQSLLAREDDLLFFRDDVENANIDGSDAGRATTGMAPVEHFIDDLITFVTLNYEHSDASIVDLIQLMIPRAVALIVSCSSSPNSSSSFSLSNGQLQRLLPRVLYMLQEPQQEEQQEEEEIENQVQQSLLELLNQNLTVPRLDQILRLEQDSWMALNLALTAVQKRSFKKTKNQHRLKQNINVLSMLPLWFLTLNLLEHFQTNIILKQEQQEYCGSQNKDIDFCRTWNGWIQAYLLQEQERAYESLEDLQKDVDEFWGQVEQYGIELMDTALQLMEDEEGQQLLSLEDKANSKNGEEVIAILQLAALATSFLAWLKPDEGASTMIIGNTSFQVLGRSLWRALGDFIVQRLEDHHQQLRQETIGTLGLSSVVGEEYQLAATDTLWRLTKALSANGSMHEDTSSLIVATIFRLWKHSDHYWNDETLAWIKAQMERDISIRHALQAALLSLVYLPNGSGSPDPSLTRMLGEWLFDEIGPDQQEDPWQSLVHEQLAEYSIELQENETQAS